LFFPPLNRGKLTTATGYMNGEATVEALQQYVDLVVTHHVAPSSEDIAAFSGTDLFQSGLVSMLWNGRWPLADFRANTDLNFGTVSLPAGKAGNANVLCWAGFAMYSGSENKDAAWEVLKFLSAGEGAEAFATYALTAVQPIAESQNLAEDPYDAPIIADLENVMPIPESSNSRWNECGNTAFQENLARVFLEDVSVQQAMDDAAAQADACFAEAPST
jgi:multiple sugar transport system substrate-binding protein